MIFQILSLCLGKVGTLNCVTLPDNDVIGSTHGVQSPTPQCLLKTATQTSILPHLTSSSLSSLPQLYDHGCEVLLAPADLHVVKDGTFVLQNGVGTQVLHGNRNPVDHLWDIKTPQTPSVFPSQRSLTTSTKDLPYHIDKVTMATLNETIKNHTAKFSSHSSTSKSTITPVHKLNIIIRKRKLKQDLAKFLVGDLCSARPSSIKKR